MIIIFSPEKNLSFSDFLPTLINNMLLKICLGVLKVLGKILPKAYV